MRNPLAPVFERLGHLSFPLIIGGFIGLDELTGIHPGILAIGALFAMYSMVQTEPMYGEDAPNRTTVSGTVTQTIPPSKVDDFALGSDLQDYVTEHELALHTVQTGYRTRVDEWLASKTLLNRFAATDAEHVVHEEPLPEGSQVEFEAALATAEQTLQVREVEA